MMTRYRHARALQAVSNCSFAVVAGSTFTRNAAANAGGALSSAGATLPVVLDCTAVSPATAPSFADVQQAQSAFTSPSLPPCAHSSGTFLLAWQYSLLHTKFPSSLLAWQWCIRVSSKESSCEMGCCSLARLFHVAAWQVIGCGRTAEPITVLIVWFNSPTSVAVLLRSLQGVLRG